MKKPWYNYWKDPYDGNESAFQEIKELPLIQQMEENAEVFHHELLQLIALKEGKLIEHYAKSMYEDGGWSTIAIKTWGIDVPQNKDACPAISHLLENNPKILSFSVNQLKAGKAIKAHTGDTNAIWRYHMGLEIPDSLPACGFRAKDEMRSWEKYKVMGFCDAYEHEAWNNSSADRLIICFDILKDEYVPWQRSICFNVRSFLVLHFLASKFPALKKLPKWFHRFLFWQIYALLFLLYPYQKRKGVIKSHN